jgi:hypothetical protein
MTGQQVDALFLTENVGLSNYQVLDTPPGIADVIRDASGAVRNIRGFFDNGHLHVGSVAFGPAGGTHAGRISADDDKVHKMLPFNIGSKMNRTLMNTDKHR